MLVPARHCLRARHRQALGDGSTRDTSSAARPEALAGGSNPEACCWLLEFQVSKDEPRYKLRQRLTLNSNS
jgi:hypothetical protein